MPISNPVRAGIYVLVFKGYEILCIPIEEQHAEQNPRSWVSVGPAGWFQFEGNNWEDVVAYQVEIRK